MSVWGDFVKTARAILDEKTPAAAKEQPPVFVRTTWLYVEIDEAIERAKALSQQIKVARLSANADEARRLTNEIINTVTQIAELCDWADQQFQREAST